MKEREKKLYKLFYSLILNFKNHIPQNLKNVYHTIQSLFFNFKYGFPSKNLKLIGITGSSGKSTTAEIIYHILKENRFKVGLISTISAKVGNDEIETGLHVTTPDPWDIPKYLKLMKDNKIEWVVLECSSHGLDQNRMWGLKFKYAVFTNITHDHFDYHKTWDRYAASKGKLIDLLENNGSIFYNHDDKDASIFIKNKSKNKKVKMIRFSIKEVNNVNSDYSGIRFDYSGKKFSVPIMGEYNVWNILAAIKLGVELKIEIKDIAKALEGFKGIKGHMEVLQISPFMFIVNFSHNSDALEKTLVSLRKTIVNKGRIIVVFGSAGLRDVDKRWMMGEIAAKYADIIIITAEDPRTESLKSINCKILKGASRYNGELVDRFDNENEYKMIDIDLIKHSITKTLKEHKKPVIIFDEESTKSRENAIEFSIKIAENNDIVISEGKGHEKSMCFGDTEYPWSDQEVAIKYLKLIKS